MNIGTVIHGTLRTQDLIPAFLKELNKTDDTLPADEGDLWWYSEEAQEMVNYLIDELDEKSPPYTYFGASEGDGSAFGYWPELSAYSVEDLDCEGVFVCDDSSQLSSPSCHHSQAFVINDHGNVSYYEWSGHEWELIWDCV